MDEVRPYDQMLTYMRKHEPDLAAVAEYYHPTATGWVKGVRRERPQFASRRNTAIAMLHQAIGDRNGAAAVEALVEVVEASADDAVLNMFYAQLAAALPRDDKPSSAS
jgi:hypothetical protein